MAWRNYICARSLMVAVMSAAGAQLLLGGAARAGVFDPPPPIVYVDAAQATDLGSGATWATAKKTIQAGINTAGVGSQVWVKAGIYSEDRSLGDASGALVMKSGVTVYGSFAGTETTLTQRSLVANVTVINGTMARLGLPAYHVVKLDTVTSTALDGFAIVGGAANGFSDFNGGGIFCSGADASNAIRNCVISGNTANQCGGGILCDAGSSPEISNCVIDDNYAVYYGGGLCCFSNSAPTAMNCTISKNTAVSRGGGLYCEYASPAVTNCVFEGNYSDKGGGVLCVNDAHPQLTNTIFTHNSIVAIYELNGSGTPTVSNCLFYGNLDDYAQYYYGWWWFYTNAPDINMNVPTASNNISGDPMFLMDGPAATTGMLSGAPYYNVSINQTSFTIAGVSLTPGALAGRLINADVTQTRESLITSNTATTIMVWGNITDTGLNIAHDGDAWKIADYHLRNGSAAIDTGTTVGAPALDFEGDARPGSDGKADIGVDEADPSYLPSDSLRPVSSVVDLPFFQTALVFDVPYSATDNDSGVRYVHLFYRKDGEPWTQYGGDYTGSPISFTASAPGDGYYEFYTIATDYAGFEESVKTTADAAARIVTSYSASRIYVTLGGAGNRTGEDWANAAPDITGALTLAGSFGVPEVWVAAGTYYEAISIPDGVHLYGGFAGNETAFEQRNVKANVTVIDGSRSGSGLSGYGPSALHTVIMDGISSACIDGFTIMGGMAEGAQMGLGQPADPDLMGSSALPWSADKMGGGIICNNLGTTVTIANCTITSNWSWEYYGGDGGAGIALLSSSPDIINCLIIGNHSCSLGAGLYMENSSPVVTSCVIGGNITAPLNLFSNPRCGSGIYSENSAAIIRDCAINGNSVSSNWESYGGGAYVGQYSSDQYINCIFSGNWAFNVLPGYPADGGALYCANNGSVAIINCTISDNGAFSGGGIAAGDTYANVTIINTAFVNNMSYAIYEEFTSPPPAAYLPRSLENHLAGKNDIPGYTTWISLENCLFYNNPDGDYHTASGSILTGAADIDANAPNATNSVDGDPAFRPGLNGTLSFAPILDTTRFRTLLTLTGAVLTPGGLVGQPIAFDGVTTMQFVITSNTASLIEICGDASGATSITLRWQIMDYHITSQSAAIDVGTASSSYGYDAPLADIEGTTRPLDALNLGGSAFDIGAYEYIPNFTLTLGVEGDGAAQATPSGPVFPYPTIVSIQATANSGASFTGWEGDVPPGQEMDNPLVIIMDSDKALTATFARDAGTVVVEVTPPTASWSFTDGDGAIHVGVGNQTTTGIATGAIAMTWGALANYDAPAATTHTLVKDAVTTFTGVYIRQTGTVVVQVTPPSASWSFTDGDGALHAGVGNQTTPGIPTGAIGITWGALANYDAPAATTQTLAKNNVTTFTGVYTRQTGTVVVEITPPSASWSFRDGDGAVHAGVGNQTTPGIPTGAIGITWGALPNYDAPAATTQTLAKNDVTTFTGIYIRQKGTVVVNVTPPTASWSFTDGDGAIHAGVGNQTTPGIPTGAIGITWGALANYDAPAATTQTLAKDAVTTFIGIYVRQTGTVVVEVTPGAASWSFTDGDGAVHAGVGNQTTPGIPTGAIGITWGALANYDSPAATTQTLVKDSVTTFIGIYIRQTGTVVVEVTPTTASWSYTDGDGGIHAGVGNKTTPGIPIGAIGITWGALANYDAPAATTQTLVKDAVTTFTGIYIRQTGTVVVEVTPAAASWSFTDGDGALHEGVGNQTTSGIPTGAIGMNWGALANYDSPAATTQTLSNNSVTTFTGIYVRQTGTVVVEVTPSIATWSFTDGDGVIHTGAGNQTTTGVPTGAIDIYWDPLLDYRSPANAENILAKDEVTTFVGIYERITGTVIVNVVPESASWSFTDGDGVIHSGTGSTVDNNVPTGDIGIIWHDLAGYDTPPASTQTLSVSREIFVITFYGVYIRQTGTVAVEVTPSSASWSFTDGDGFIHTGAGNQTTKGIPTGDIAITWDPLPNYDAPANTTQTLVKDSVTTFIGIYTRQTGTVVVEVSPPTASWSFTDGDGAVHAGAGNQTTRGIPTGEIGIIWGALAGYDAPAATTQTLVKDGVTTFIGIYVRQTGTVVVEVTPPIASWSFTDGDGGVHAGVGNQTTKGVPTGAIGMTWDALPGYDSPAATTQTLAKDDVTTFTGIYIRQTGIVVVQVTPPTASWAFRDGDGVVHTGVGNQTTTGVPTGNIPISWGALPNYDAPAATSQTLVKDSTITFIGIYTRQTGTVVVQVTPPTASWSFTDGDGAIHAGVGNQTTPRIPTGEIGIIWGALPNYDAPAATTQTLMKDAVTTFTGVYIRHTGTVVVEVTPPTASWSFTDGDGGVHAGVGNQTTSGIPTGAIGITWGALPGYDSPAATTQTLVKDGVTTFTGIYIRQTGTVVVQVTPVTASWAFRDGDGVVHAGVGNQTTTGVPTGNIPISWGALPNYDAPAATSQTLVKDSVITFIGIYVRQTGTVVVEVTPGAASWSFTDGDGTVHAGVGNQTAKSIPTGAIAMAWGALPNYDAPANTTQTLAKDSVTTFTGIYIRQTGTVVVLVTPPSATWSFKDGDGVAHPGAGNRTTTGIPTGEIPMTWGALANYDSPADTTHTLTKDGVTTFIAVYTRQMGTVIVQVTPSTATWSFTDSDGGVHAGAGNQTRSGVPAGPVSMAWGALPNYDAPADTTQTLPRNGTITFTGVYTRQVGTVVVQVTPGAASWSFTDGDGAVHAGAGNQTTKGIPTGAIAMTWGALPNYDAPANTTQTLAKDSVTTFTGIYIRHTGTVVVQVTPPTASWSFTDGDGAVHAGAGSQTALGVPTGAIGMTWGALPGYDAPANTTQTLTKDSVTTFIGIYVRQMGTVVVQVAPPTATWSFRDGDGMVHAGAGNQTTSGVPTGAIGITWGPLPNFDAPAATTQTLAKGGVITFIGAYVRQTGTVVVQVTPGAASWSFTDGDGAVHAGAGNQTTKGIPTGAIGITWGALANYDAPAATTQTLSKDSVTTFTGIYIRHTGTVVVQVTPGAASWSFTDGDGDVHAGAGNQTTKGIPTGAIGMTWGTLANYDAPAATTQTLAKDAVTTFTGIYIRQTGTVVVTVTTQSVAKSLLNVSWSFTDGDGGIHVGAGNQTTTGVPTGVISIAWGALPNFDAPPSTSQTLTKNGLITFAGVYARQTGTVVVQVTPPSATWSFTDGDGAAHTGAGDQTIPRIPTGGIALTWESLPYYEAPSPNPTSQTLIKDGQVTFIGVYQPTTGRVIVNVSPANAAWLLTGPSSYTLASSGSATFDYMVPGDYTIVWTPLAEWDEPASATQSLKAGATITFTGIYQRQTGTVIVQVDPEEAHWSFVDSQGLTYNGSGNAVTSGVPAGDVTLTWQPVPDTILPSPATRTQLLMSSQTIVFKATYHWPLSRIGNDWLIVYKINGRRHIPTPDIMAPDGRGIVLPPDAGPNDTLAIYGLRNRANPTQMPTWIEYIQSDVGGLRWLYTQANVRQMNVNLTVYRITAINSYVENINITGNTGKGGGLKIVRMSAVPDSQLPGYTSPQFDLPLDNRNRFAVTNIDVADWIYHTNPDSPMDYDVWGKLQLNGVILKHLAAPWQVFSAIETNSKINHWELPDKTTSTVLSFGGILRAKDDAVSDTIQSLGIWKIKTNGGPIAPYALDSAGIMVKVSANANTFTLGKGDKRVFASDVCPVAFFSRASPTMKIMAKGGNVYPELLYGDRDENPYNFDYPHEIEIDENFSSTRRITSRYFMQRLTSGTVLVGGRVGYVPDLYSDSPTSAPTMWMLTVGAERHRRPPHIGAIYADFGIFGWFMASPTMDADQQPIAGTAQAAVRSLTVNHHIPVALQQFWKPWWGHICGRGYSNKPIIVKPSLTGSKSEFLDMDNP